MSHLIKKLELTSMLNFKGIAEWLINLAIPCDENNYL